MGLKQLKSKFGLNKLECEDSNPSTTAGVTCFVFHIVCAILCLVIYGTLRIFV